MKIIFNFKGASNTAKIWKVSLKSDSAADSCH
jgi:hypothetical protein